MRLKLSLNTLLASAILISTFSSNVMAMDRDADDKEAVRRVHQLAESYMKHEIMFFDCEKEQIEQILNSAQIQEDIRRSITLGDPIAILTLNILVEYKFNGKMQGITGYSEDVHNALEDLYSYASQGIKWAQERKESYEKKYGPSLGQVERGIIRSREVIAAQQIFGGYVCKNKGMQKKDLTGLRQRALDEGIEESEEK